MGKTPLCPSLEPPLLLIIFELLKEKITGKEQNNHLLIWLMNSAMLFNHISVNHNIHSWRVLVRQQLKMLSYMTVDRGMSHFDGIPKLGCQNVAA